MGKSTLVNLGRYGPRLAVSIIQFTMGTDEVLVVGSSALCSGY